VLDFEHGSCKVKTDRERPRGHSVILVESEAPTSSMAVNVRPTVAEISREGDMSVENRTSATKNVVIMGAAGRAITQH
jgi:hypothetical protein